MLFVAGIVHGCLHPDNVLLKTTSGQLTVKMTGFESSQVCTDSEYVTRWIKPTMFTAPEIADRRYTMAADL